ncbi:universal stress protein [Vibrio sp. SS-MA-C1-2]|uniref:universal stress protein n=1 Tax=Vibrio sp. SS-MA-C1-2 TaxID=2908646 RepID=UPI001F4474BD|nr:universal stress protein [Vibrio sp. SS-MA-C1-2]UJF19741.1 universal stress protein [Vibrio sp. SS-MA-C1-2]
MNKIITCIDGSITTNATYNAATWTAEQLQKPIVFLHALEKQQQHGADDFTGAIGLGARSALLTEMASLDAKKSKLQRQHSKEMLTALQSKAIEQGLTETEIKQCHDDLIDALVDLEPETRLVIAGRAGNHGSAGVGSHIETLVRSVKSSVLLVPSHFTAPTSFILAYDGKETADKAIIKIINSDLLKGLTCHLVMVKPTENSQDVDVTKLPLAQQQLEECGFKVESNILEGDIFEVLNHYKDQHQIDMVAMGAFSHNKIRQLFLGSNTMKMIESINTPLIILQ